MSTQNNKGKMCTSQTPSLQSDGFSVCVDPSNDLRCPVCRRYSRVTEKLLFRRLVFVIVKWRIKDTD